VSKINRLKTTMFINVLLVLISLSGCAGVTVISSTGTKYMIDDNSVARPDENARGYTKNGVEHRRMTKEEILLAWGEPDKLVKLNENTIKWVYHREWALHGALVMVVVIPVPLFVPWGYRDIEVVIDRGKVTSILYHYSYTRYCGVSLFGLTLHGLTSGGMSCDFEEKPWEIVESKGSNSID